MKKWGNFFITAALLAALLCACGAGERLSCTVTEVYDNAVMAVCTEAAGTIGEGQKVYISCESMPELAPGDAILVTYRGEVLLSEPAQIVASKVEIQDAQ